MLNMKLSGGDSFDINVYIVKEYNFKDVARDGIVNKVVTVDTKTLVNPPESYLQKENVKVVYKRNIKVQVMEVNRVGGKITKPKYFVGLRLIDNGKPTNTFHIMVENDEEFRERVKNEVLYYLRVKDFALEGGGVSGV